MRILFISNLYPPHELGGMELRCHEMVDSLRRRGHTCHVLTSRFGACEQISPQEGVTRKLYLQADVNYYHPLDFFLRRPWRERANSRVLRRLLDEFEPDIVFVWGMWNLSSCLAHNAETWLPGRVAYSVGSYWLIKPDAHEAYWQRPARRQWIRWLLAPARWFALRTLARQRKTCSLALEHVTCVSEYARLKLDSAGALPHGARVIYNGIDPSPFLEASEQRESCHEGFRLIYTGAILPHKGVHRTVEAMGLLRRWGIGDGLTLRLVGGGHPAYEAQVRARAAELGVDSQVIFQGRVPRRQIPTLLSKSDAFLFTSTWEEPFGRSVTEAMASGLPVVGTAVGAQREILEDGANALVFPPGDAASLARCVQRLHRDPGLCARLAEAGQRTVLERFTLERMVDETERWLISICQRP